MSSINLAPTFPIILTITNNLSYAEKDVKEKNADQLGTRPSRNIQFFQVNMFKEIMPGASLMVMVDSSDALNHYLKFANSGLTIKRSDEEDFYEFTEEEREQIVDLFYDAVRESGIAPVVGTTDEQGHYTLAFAYNDIDWEGSTVQDIEAAFVKVDNVVGVDSNV